jgi:hypothetical protein
MNHFCTYCDQGYAARMLCLHESLRASGEPFQLCVLCFDAETEAVVKAAQQADLIPVALRELLAADPEYAAVRARRTPVECYFTATPVLVRHCLNREPAAERMTYLDADLFFFGPPSGVFAEQGDAAVGIVPHRFPARLAERLIYGTYNVAWVSFRRNADGLACLEWWRTRCLEWCHDRVEQGRFADQGYLDEFPRQFAGVRALHHAGVNAAPWNIGGARVARKAGRVQVDDQPLLFYHFQGVRELAPGWFEPGLRAYGNELGPSLRALIYEPYLARLVAVQRELRAKHGIAPAFLAPRLNAGATWRDRWERFKARWLWPYLGRVNGRLVRAR